MTKREELYNFDTEVTIKRYQRKDYARKVYVVASGNLEFSSVVLDPKLEDNKTLLSKLPDAFSERHRPEVNNIFDLEETSIKYSFSIPEVLKIVSRNPSVESYASILDLFNPESRERIDG